MPGTLRVLGPVDVTLTEPVVAVIGANGSGKSTFVRLLNGLVQPTAGSVTVHGADAFALRGPGLERLKRRIMGNAAVVGLTSEVLSVAVFAAYALGSLWLPMAVLVAVTVLPLVGLGVVAPRLLPAARPAGTERER